jgi:hypothetical protein
MVPPWIARRRRRLLLRGGGGAQRQRVWALVEDAHVTLASAALAPRMLEKVVKDEDPLLARTPEVLVEVKKAAATAGLRLWLLTLDRGRGRRAGGGRWSEEAVARRSRRGRG